MKNLCYYALIANLLSACTTIELVCPAVPSRDCQQWQQSEHSNAVKEWNSNGFTYIEAKQWLDKGIDVKTAKLWLKKGFTRNEAITYIGLNQDIKAAKRWKNASYTLAEAKKFIQQGILTPKAATQRKRVKLKAKY